MANPQLQPFEINPQTGEIFLRLRSHNDIIVTPLRRDDWPYTTTLLNDPLVHIWLGSPPYPYLPEHAVEFISTAIEKDTKCLADLEAARDTDVPKIVDTCPVGAIREVKEDGTDNFLGHIGFFRCPWMELAGSVDWDKKDERVKENNAREAGDPEIVWTVGYYLAPSHHGQGIMGDVVDTLLNEWAIPRMHVRKMIGTAFLGNPGSIRVLEKNGFKLRETLEDHSVVKGVLRGIHVLEWTFKDSAQQ